MNTKSARTDGRFARMQSSSIPENPPPVFCRPKLSDAWWAGWNHEDQKQAAALARDIATSRASSEPAQRQEGEGAVSPRYRLCLVAEGEHILNEHGKPLFAAETLVKAREYHREWSGDEPANYKSWRASGRVAYASDIEDGDCHEDCEPGDTTYDLMVDDGRPLLPHEVRVWERLPVYTPRADG